MAQAELERKNLAILEAQSLAQQNADASDSEDSDDSGSDAGSNHAADEIFEDMDTNDDGKVDLAEHAEFFNYSDPLGDDNIYWFNEFDTDGNLAFDKGEYRAIYDWWANDDEDYSY